MALSNIFKEPRREITETAMGIGLAITPALLAQTAFPMYSDHSGDMPVWVGFLIWMPLTWAGTVIILLLLFAAHALGEELCNRLQAAGIRLRPLRPGDRPSVRQPPVWR